MITGWFRGITKTMLRLAAVAQWLEYRRTPKGLGFNSRSKVRGMAPGARAEGSPSVCLSHASLPPFPRSLPLSEKAM